MGIWANIKTGVGVLWHSGNLLRAAYAESTDEEVLCRDRQKTLRRVLTFAVLAVGAVAADHHFGDHVRSCDKVHDGDGCGLGLDGKRRRQSDSDHPMDTTCNEYEDAEEKLSQRHFLF